jgi:hypothetical protein
MTFVYVYNALQLTNAAWMNFLVEGLDFSAWMIGIVSIVGSIMAWFGIMTYKRFFFASNWALSTFGAPPWPLRLHSDNWSSCLA